jgi:hypothetical protein
MKQAPNRVHVDVDGAHFVVSIGWADAGTDERTIFRSSSCAVSAEDLAAAVHAAAHHHIWSDPFEPWRKT